MKVIGTGVGRTGTYSLKLALNELGLGPCHHMEAVLHDMAGQVPLWNAALEGRADWSAVYDGFSSAVDWPTACFFRELHTAFPDARFVLTTRSAESWAESFSGTIYRLLSGRNGAPAGMQEWLAMSAAVIARTGFPEGLDKEALMQRFEAHNAAVREAIPADRLLVFDVRDGWAPLCTFLGVEEPAGPFPRTNHREEFWDRVSGEA